MTDAGATATRRSSDRPQAVIRLKAPQDGVTVIEDMVQGTVTFPNNDLDDLVLLRSDGTPTYMLAVVVDDHDMGVTNIIRGDDHLTNAARQTQIYRAMGWDVPAMAHIPLIHGPDGAKLSKRHGALAWMPIATWAICRPLCAIIWCASAGAMATRALFHRGNDPVFRPRPGWPLGGAFRFPEARKPQRPIYACRRRCGASRRG